MSARARLLVAALGAAGLMLGLGCLNYTKAGTIAHHRHWAAANHFPPPSRTILFAGVALVSLGSGAIGFTVGCRRRRNE